MMNMNGLDGGDPGPDVIQKMQQDMGIQSPAKPNMKYPGWRKAA